MDSANKNSYCITPKEKRGRSQFIIRSIILTCVIGASFFIATTLHASSTPIPLPVILTLAGLYIFLLIFSLSGKIAQSITIDFASQKLIIQYATVVSNAKTISINLKDVSYSYKWQPSKYPPPKNRLKIFTASTIIYQIDTSDDGFKKTQFDSLIAEFIKLNLPIHP